MGLFDNVYQTPVQQPVYQYPPQQPAYQYPQQPAYQPGYQQDAFGSSLQDMASRVYQLQQTVQSQGAYGANNYGLQQQCNALITRLGQYQQALSNSGYYQNSPYQATINDLAARLQQIQTTLQTTPQYQYPQYPQYPQQQYPQPYPQPYPQQPYPQYPQQQYPQPYPQPYPDPCYGQERPWRRRYREMPPYANNDPFAQINQIFQSFAGALQGQQPYYRQ
jgi:hypothetical protein